MAVLDLCHYNLRAPRPLLDALCRFYEDVVGLRVGARPPLRSSGFWLYAGERSILHLSETRPDEQRHAGAVNTFDHAAFRCRGLAQVERHLQERKVPYRIVRVESTGQVQLFLQDPAGNGVELNFAGDEA